MQDAEAKICSVVAEESVAAAVEAIHQAAPQADMIEVRLDYLRDFDFHSVEQLEMLLKGRQLPTIITCRSVEEGGKQTLANSTRLPLLIEGAKRFADYCDIEAAHYEEAARLSPDYSKLIVSYHNFDETPEDIEAIYERLTRLPARIHKIAVGANRLTDSLAIFRLLERAQREGRTLIAIAMNETGMITRLLGCSRGSFLTYGSREEAKQSAPGQPSCSELRELYRIHRLSLGTQITGLIGNPVSHSLSPAIHNSMYAALNLDAVYLPLEVDNLNDFFKRFVKPESREISLNFRGFSITIPHKVAIIPFLDKLHPTAVKIGAVNTIVVEDNKLIGYNTDVAGVMQPLEKICHLAGQKCGVIGAGGAARAVIFGLLERQAQVTVFTRNLTKAHSLENEFTVKVYPVESLITDDSQILINTTPVGMQGHSARQSIIPAAILEHRPIVYDLVYNPLETRLLKEAKAAGCITIGGLDMLVAQACLQFQLWTGEQPEFELMRDAALKKLALSK